MVRSRAASPKHHRTERTERHIEFDRFDGIVESLKEMSPLGKNVKSDDALLGAALSLGLGAVVKFGLNWLNVKVENKIPGVIMSYAGPLSTFLAGAALYTFQRKEHRGRAEGHLVGASVAALAPVVWTLLGKYGPKLKTALPDGSVVETPFFSDYVMTPYGLLTSDQPDQQMSDYVMTPYGMLTADQQFGAPGDFDNGVANEDVFAAP